jgi:hypothetical protein
MKTGEDGKDLPRAFIFLKNIFAQKKMPDGKQPPDT